MDKYPSEKKAEHLLFKIDHCKTSEEYFIYRDTLLNIVRDLCEASEEPLDNEGPHGQAEPQPDVFDNMDFPPHPGNGPNLLGTDY